MRKDRVQLILLVAIAALFFFGWRYYRDASEHARVAKVVSPLPVPEERKREIPFIEYTAAPQRDPFTLPSAVKTRIFPSEAEEVTPTVVSAELNLQGIIWEPFPAAIINNKVVKKGDLFYGAEIVDITKEGVKVVIGGKEFFLQLKRR